MHVTQRRRIVPAVVLSASALACDGTVEVPKSTVAPPATGIDAGPEAGPLTPVVTPHGGSGGGTSADGGARDDDDDDGGEATSDDPSARDAVPLFVAVGEEGRTLVSCDDGQSWVADKSSSTSPCSGSNCDHSPTIATSLAYADGRWFATRGWGFDGPVISTQDGETWSEVIKTGTWNGVAATKGLVYVQGAQNKASTNGGGAFDDRPSVAFEGHVRGDVYFLDGKLWLVSDMGTVRSSTDQGRTWQAPRQVDASCLRDTQFHQGGLAYDGKGVLVFVNSTTGVVCRSTDHGATFQVSANLGTWASSPLVYADAQFWVWTRPTRLRRSRDGVTWSDESTNARSLMPVARSPQGTWVGADDVYANQQMLRSKDGLNWEVLPSSRFKTGHRIRRIVFGMGKKPRACE